MCDFRVFLLALKGFWVFLGDLSAVLPLVRGAFEPLLRGS